MTTIIEWDRYPLTAETVHARKWLAMVANLQRAQNTVEAYGRGIEDFLTFSLRLDLPAESATKEHIALWVNELATRVNPRCSVLIVTGRRAGLSDATIQQKITVARLFFDYLVEEGLRTTNPVGRGRYSHAHPRAVENKRGIFRPSKKLPWIPTEDQWQALVRVINEEPLRNKLMFALAYDGALRREEVCSLEVDDLDPIHRTLRVRAEVSKTKRGRVVVFSRDACTLLNTYLSVRPRPREDTNRLFLSESRRNFGRPISSSTWTKAAEAIAERSGVEQFTTHTLRHLRLTDLARDGLDLNEIAEFAGHSSLATTRLYIHLSGREWTGKFQTAMDSINAWRKIKLKT